MRLVDYLNGPYRDHHDFRDSTRTLYIRQVRMLAKFLGREPSLSDLTESTYNKFVSHLLDSGKSRSTIKSVTAVIKAIWDDAALDKLIERRGRIRQVKVPQHQPKAFSLDEVVRLLGTVESMGGVIPGTKIQASIWWSGLVRTSWDTGIRQGDLLTAERDSYGSQAITLVQSKTWRPIARQVSESTAAVLNELLRQHNSDTLFPWPTSQETFRKHVSAIFLHAGLRLTFKALRKSSGTNVDSHSPGAGNRHLDNSERVFRNHYLDPTLNSLSLPKPSELPTMNLPSNGLKIADMG